MRVSKYTKTHLCQILLYGDNLTCLKNINTINSFFLLFKDFWVKLKDVISLRKINLLNYKLTLQIKIKMVVLEMAVLPKVIFYILFYISILLSPPTEAIYCKRYLTSLPEVWLILFLLRKPTSMDLVLLYV